MEQGVRKSTDEARRLLGECFLFHGLGPEERKELTTRAHIRRFATGDTIFHMGSPGSSMMAVLSGEVRISISSPEGRELLLAILQPGEVFGEIALLDGKERSADAKAHSACSLAILERREVLAFLEHHPDAWPRIVEVLCERFRDNTQHVAEVALMQLPARLAKALLRMDAERKSTDPRSGRGQLSQRELGNLVGAARESVNKCLNDWQRRGVIRIEDNQLAILDRAALERLAH
ncbi:MAG TPA: Crp/Fnr family transcriptional regulator [Beijerinckiaceae bacterium]|nr:Crp/Fnr family transcriptional regulator [Beijerinckiaceae bacterium]